MPTDIYQILENYWGHSHFRALQEDIIRSVLAGNDTLGLMPTGGGKSVCFQVPALLNPGICIVISPLIALMKDQVENLRAKGIKATAIVSGMGKREIDITLDNCIFGDIKFLYLSPERLLSDLVRERIRHMKVNLIAVDEAHCISQWGYDFRPPYLHLADLRELHPNVPMLALTATATVKVAEDIQHKLAFSRPNLFRMSFERKNLGYVVSKEEDKFKRLFLVAKNVKGCGVVYVRNRRLTQEVSRLLNNQGFSADFYHAGLDHEMRSTKQEAWKHNRTRIIVATNAFGMGIDKPDVRFVVHLDLPESPEAYFQEAGRAGRDEKKAYAVLLYDNADLLQLRRKLEVSFPSREEIIMVYHQLGNFYQLAYGAGEGLSLDFDLVTFCTRFKLEPAKTMHALKFLEKEEYIVMSESVYLPSRIRITISQEDLYKFQIEHAVYDPFIKLLLRSYGGLFDQYTAIREYDISKRMDGDQQQVVTMLEKLQELEIIEYLKQSDRPQIHFIKPRVSSSNVYIKRKYLEERKEVMTDQVDAIIRYATLKQCRSLQLLLYFGDAGAGKCGVCDVCLKENKREKNRNLSEMIINEAIQVLSTHHYDLDTLVNSIRNGNERDRIRIIRDLLDAGKIRSDGNKYYL